MKAIVPLDDYIVGKIGEWADRVVGEIRVELHNQGVDASGNLSSSIEWSIDGDDVQILADDYFFYSEAGRTPGRIPYAFTDILETWISDKGVIRPAKFKTDRQFASAIAYKIKNYGSSRYRGDRPKADLVGPVLDAELPKLNELVENRLVMYINDTLFE